VKSDLIIFEELLNTEDDCVADDIAVRFYEQDDEGNVRWEDYGNFANHDVHRQVMFLQLLLHVAYSMMHNQDLSWIFKIRGNSAHYLDNL